MVLDTCFRLHCEIVGGSSKKKSSHSQRPALLAEYYGIPAPSWSEPRPGSGSDLAELRNELFHEAQYARQPIGFAHPKFVNSIDLELAAFNTRLILALMSIPCEYIHSDVQQRQTYGLDLEW